MGSPRALVSLEQHGGWVVCPEPRQGTCFRRGLQPAGLLVGMGCGSCAPAGSPPGRGAPRAAGVGPTGQGDSTHRPLFQVVNRLGLDSLSPFNPKERIIE